MASRPMVSLPNELNSMTFGPVGNGTLTTLPSTMAPGVAGNSPGLNCVPMVIVARSPRLMAVWSVLPCPDAMLTV